MSIKSHFAPPEYASHETVLNQFSLISNSPFLDSLLQTVCGLLAVLNENRQIVALNDTFMDMLGIAEPSKALGLRPGEALQCIHKDDGPSGCGTTKFCSTCGAALAIVAALGEEKPVERLCALTHEKNGSVIETVFHVTARPVKLNEVHFVLIFLQDVTEQQRRAALERTFFHDVSNLLNMLVQAGELLKEDCDSELVHTVNASVMRLAKEVEIQRIFAGSEKADISIRKETVDLKALMNDLQGFFNSHPASINKQLVFSPIAESLTLTTDISLLSRVLENMVINALEASPEGNQVTMKTQTGPDGLTFSVHNNTFIQEDTARRIFQRNFSTKSGPGRGYGTYAMKLLGEELLGGKVGFTSSPQSGTVFTFLLPAEHI